MSWILFSLLCENTSTFGVGFEGNINALKKVSRQSQNVLTVIDTRLIRSCLLHQKRWSLTQGSQEFSGEKKTALAKNSFSLENSSRNIC